MLIDDQCRLATIQFATWLLAMHFEAGVCTHDNTGHSKFWRCWNAGTALGGNAKPGDNAAGDTTGRCRVDQGASSARRCRNGNERASAVSLLSTRAIHRTPRPYPYARTVPASVSVLIDPSSKNESDASFLCSLGLP
jgi:hypothetical protein